uniref:Thiamine-binding periplasmic protein n=1 Tax=Candidatus Aschnera chinzeii TaxID=1485666 RepID=A0AAT9G4N4_9ENTR|nr:MAG: thiamine ABC transporter substrate binding subunit [Candidatus Aschnera chinzeii]
MLKTLTLKILFISIFYYFSYLSYAKPVLTVYTYNSFLSPWGTGPIVKKYFEEICNCTVRFVSHSNGIIMLNKIIIENKDSPADVILGLDNSLIAKAKKTDLFITSTIKLNKIHLPIKWKDYIFIPYDYGYLAFIYNKKFIKKIPTSLNELIYNNNLWTIIYQDPRISTPGLGLLFWMNKIYDNNINKVWQQFAKNTVTITKDWGEAYHLFLKRESDFVLSYTSSPFYHILKEHNNNYVAAIFNEGHYIQVEVMAQLKYSKHPKLAQKFINFMLTKKIQTIIPLTNWMYPVIDVDLPEVYKRSNIPKKIFQFSSEHILRQRDVWLNIWLTSVSH